MLDKLVDERHWFHAYGSQVLVFFLLRLVHLDRHPLVFMLLDRLLFRTGHEDLP